MISQKKILVVEDNDINRAMLSEILSSEYDVLEAENGLAALAYLKKYGAAISLIMLDIVMPVMDGYTFLSHVKADPAYSSIPVIVTTQSEDESDEVTALSHGAADFVTKPYKPRIILHRAANIINLRETASFMNQVQYDQLTGLYSKEFFYQKTKEILTLYPERNYDIICSDIENFKLFNDVFGTSAGDNLLMNLADMLRDRVGEWGICGRFTGDKFVCLLEHLVEYNDELFSQINTQINALSSVRNIVMKWGIYSVTDRSLPIEKMCDRALLATGSIKGKYGKHFARYDDELRSKLLREQSITDSMEPALTEGQFEIYLQPKYRIRDNTLAGAEALVRWNHPQWGLQSPALFIPLFEQNGFITRMDQYIWEQACAALRDWKDKGYPVIPVSVNVSRADIYNENLTDILLRIIHKYDLPPSLLHLEITETAYTENPGQIIETVTNLRKLGFVIEMDDFGSGYSSLNMLNQMPIDILKLDMKFIQSETAKPVNQGILRFIMNLARWMNLSVVAEGVETKEQLERLREIGCDYVQGYYFSKPMPRKNFEELIKNMISEAEKDCSTQNSLPSHHMSQIILVADEDDAYRSETAKTFAGRYRVVQAGDISEALARIAQYSGELAAIILSLTLKVQDQISVLDILQREKALWNIPVIATAPADAKLEERALEMGIDDFAGKPHSQTSLWKRVMRAIDINAMRRREFILQDEASRDHLTGLLNRRGLEAAVKALHKEDMPLAAYLIDLDNLKYINDTFGHMEGDRLLTEFAALLRMHTRGSDILSRFGGDEFLLLIKQMHSETHALKKGLEICGRIQKICLGGRYCPACSIGIAIWDGEEPMLEMIKRADQALYRAKVDNKGGCCLWEQEMTKTSES